MALLPILMVPNDDVNKIYGANLGLGFQKDPPKHNPELHTHFLVQRCRKKSAKGHTFRLGKELGRTHI